MMIAMVTAHQEYLLAHLSTRCLPTTHVMYVLLQRKCSHPFRFNKFRLSWFEALKLIPGLMP
jgi:hypothetical protein